MSVDSLCRDGADAQYSHSKDKGLNTGQLDFTANRGLEGLTTRQPIDLESTQSSMSPCAVFEHIQIQWNNYKT